MTIKLTPAQRELLERAAKGNLYVFRAPSKAAPGVSKATLKAVRNNGLVNLGEYEALKGYPVVLTTLGHAVLASTSGAPSQEEPTP